MYQNLRKRFGHTNAEIEHEFGKINRLTDTIQRVFNDFCVCYNSFVQREEKLMTLHTHAVKKS